MTQLTRREFAVAAAAMGAAVAFAHPAAASERRWRERRELYPEGVASGDPTSDSVIVWTRRPGEAGGAPLTLTAQIATDRSFRHVLASTATRVSAQADWTARVLVAGLKPAREYWYRFIDERGFGSRIGRTRTAPADDDPRPVRFAFVSCQNVTQGAQNAWRRMIFDDERAAPGAGLDFVLQLGDFIYEIVWYPEDRPQGMYDRRLRDLIRYPHGERIDDFHIPTSVEDYRLAYRAYLHDPDVQDARARWPFVNMWDNHEFSWKGWQSFQKFDGLTRARPTRKVAAYQAWFEYLPARVTRPGNPSLERFEPPPVVDAPVERFDEHGLGQEPNNLAALNSMSAYRALRFGRHVELIVTDQRSYRSEDPVDRAEAQPFVSQDFPEMIPEEVVQILDAGRSYQGGQPPAAIRYGAERIANFRRAEAPQTILGAEQKSWFLHRLAAAQTTWKIWANTIATLDARADPQNLPPGTAKPWPGGGYATLPLGDFGSAYLERAEIYDFVREHGITGFVTVAGDRHSFWAGLAAKALPPAPFAPVGIAFVTGSLSAPGLVEALEHSLPAPHPLRALYLLTREGSQRSAPTVNMLMRHGVRACLEYQRTRDAAAARRLSNPELAPHLSFLDFGGHGYAVVEARDAWIETQFVCIPRPLERAGRPDGGEVLYRVNHRARRWGSGEVPSLEQQVQEGNPELSL